VSLCVRDAKPFSDINPASNSGHSLKKWSVKMRRCSCMSVLAVDQGAKVDRFPLLPSKSAEVPPTQGSPPSSVTARAHAMTHSPNTLEAVPTSSVVVIVRVSSGPRKSGSSLSPRSSADPLLRSLILADSSGVMPDVLTSLFTTSFTVHGWIGERVG
jgi:hypothetical protein